MAIKIGQMEESETETTNKKNDEIMPPETAAIIIDFREIVELNISGSFETRKSRLALLTALLAAYILRSREDLLRLLFPHFIGSLPTETKNLLEVEIDLFEKELAKGINHGD